MPPAPYLRKLRWKVSLALRIWLTFVLVQTGLRRRPLPELVTGLGRPRRTRCYGVPPPRLGIIVARALRLGRRRARCLTSSLVLYRLLQHQGLPAELVIGLPEMPRGRQAHAWVEVRGVDVGPPPGRSGHVELARYG
jgi:hypothetical protein